ncbi:helix-turn-helix transcriptional regulator [Brucella anthropi]|uniref:helix-turn-helix domain-containing protein n=1 Tax=Brucella anthropi TaxID=529 RepID=UPI00124EFB13|nr:helix-turn-helix transcriptional regulator [Brucella anthropi]KAB2774421.1 helix-turn-helix transcriptional regulator [Brucella anthropi]
MQREDIAERIGKIRAKTGLSQRALAEKIGVAFRTWQSIESGKNVPSGETLLKIGELGFSPGWVLTGEGEMIPGAPQQSAASRTINKQLMHKLARLAREARKEIGGGVHGETITEDATDLYNELLSLVSSIDDMEEVEATLPRLHLLFKRKLQEQSRNREEGRNTA